MPTTRTATQRRYLLCRPTYFDVTYAINPWMDPNVDVDVDLAIAQWETLRDTYLSLGHEVETITPLPGLPDMVFAANGGLVVDGTAIGARFANFQRVPEADAYLAWFRTHGYQAARQPDQVNEGEGDFLAIGDIVLAGSGYRSVPAAHDEVAAITGREIVSLDLVDPRYYHLDTALAVLDDTTIAYLPSAFSAESLQLLRERFPDAIEASEADAAVLGLNAVSDGRNVILPVQATDLAVQITARGFTVVAVDLSELLKAGGGVKCCTLELRPARSASLPVEVSA